MFNNAQEVAAYNSPNNLSRKLKKQLVQMNANVTEIPETSSTNTVMINNERFGVTTVKEILNGYINSENGNPIFYRQCYNNLSGLIVIESSTGKVYKYDERYLRMQESANRISPHDILGEAVTAVLKHGSYPTLTFLKIYPQ